MFVDVGSSASVRPQDDQAIRPDTATSIVQPRATPLPIGRVNPIVLENQQPGTDQWRVTLNEATDKDGRIQGYASATSVNHGEPITFYITVSPVQTYTIDVFRIGWYQGLGGRLMQHIGPLSGTKQTDCPTDATTGLIVCNWTPSYTLAVPTDWTSGFYLALLTNASKFQSYVIFTVRDDSRVADLLYQQSVTTYQAYNNYPDNGTTGKSLYEYNSYGAETIAGTRRAVKVSFDRPYSEYDGAGNFLEWEIYFVRWLEQSGYDVSYSTDIDTHTNGSRLLSYKGFLSVGHDEYWSKEMYDAAVAARDAGHNLAFFGANDVYWQIRLESSASGAPNRVIVCYKDASIDPVQGPTTTVNFRNAPVNRPEQRLIGVQFISQTRENKYVPYVVANSQHWVYEGTGFRDGDNVPGLVGYETDQSITNHPLPEAVAGTYTVLSKSTYANASDKLDYSNSAIYQAPSGAWVFGAGTIGWSWGLDNFGKHTLADWRIQKMTGNVINRFIGHTPPPSVTPTAEPAPISADASYPAVVLRTSGLLAYWRLGEASGTIARDSKGFYYGAYQKGVTLGGPGALAGDSDPAGAFDGKDNYVDIPTLPAATDFTLEGWTYLNPEAVKNVNGNNTLYAIRGSIRLAARPGKGNTKSAAYAGVWLNGMEYSLEPPSTESNLNSWVHWVLTRAGGTLTLYRNGVQIAQRGDLPATATARIRGTIGAQGGGEPFLNGRIDEVALYSVALTAAQVADHYHVGINGPPARGFATPTPSAVKTR